MSGPLILTYIAWASVIAVILSGVWLAGYLKGRSDALKVIRRYQ